ncbi:MAG TPA: hypothetical protein VFN81_06675 [Sphingomicrobium sp.]|nr:hypothetical protein [Sphingomicrobium sp.]
MRPDWQEIITKTIAMIRGAPEMQKVLHERPKKFKRYFRKMTPETVTR